LRRERARVPHERLVARDRRPGDNGHRHTNTTPDELQLTVSAVAEGDRRMTTTQVLDTAIIFCQNAQEGVGLFARALAALTDEQATARMERLIDLQDSLEQLLDDLRGQRAALSTEEDPTNHHPLTHARGTP
jgi:hypothetical protein